MAWIRPQTWITRLPHPTSLPNSAQFCPPLRSSRPPATPVRERHGIPQTSGGALARRRWSDFAAKSARHASALPTSAPRACCRTRTTCGTSPRHEGDEYSSRCERQSPDQHPDVNPPSKSASVVDFVGMSVGAESTCGRVRSTSSAWAVLRSSSARATARRPGCCWTSTPPVPALCSTRTCRRQRTRAAARSPVPRRPVAPRPLDPPSALVLARSHARLAWPRCEGRRQAGSRVGRLPSVSALAPPIVSVAPR